MAVEVFGNIPSTTVSSGGTTAPAAGTQETWGVASSAGFPAVSSTATPPTQIHIADVALNSEIIQVINISGTTWTVIRGAEATTPVSHGTGFTIYQVVSAGAYAQLRSLSWLNVVTQFGADPTGAADSTTAISHAISALPSAGGVIYFPAGTYKVSSTLTIGIAGVTLQGDGLWCTAINYTGSGDCIRMYSTLAYSHGFGGGVKGITIDGTSASAGACGVHAGDIYQLQWDVGVRSFQGTGSKGIWFDNQYFWAEDMYGHVWAQSNTQNVVFDNSANVGGSATGSFARTMLDIVLDANAVGDGVTLQNGALVYDHRVTIAGNIMYGTAQYQVLSITGPPGYSFTATNASPCVFTAAGSYYSNGTIVSLSGASLPGGFAANTTVASGSNGGEISQIGTWSSPSPGVLDVASVTGFPATGGNIQVAASGATTAVLFYTGISGSSLTGCTYESGSATGTVSTGGAVTLTGGGIYYVVNASGATFEVAATPGGSPINSTSTGSGTAQAPYSRFYNGVLNIGVECNAGGAGTFQPVTINFGSQGNNQISRCTGIMDFTGAEQFATAVNWSTSFEFDGPVMGDSHLLRMTGMATASYANGAIGNGAKIATKYVSIGTAAPTVNVTGIIMGLADAGSGQGVPSDWANTLFTLANTGTGSITFAAENISNVSTGTSCVIQPGAAMVFAWISVLNTWYPISAGSGGVTSVTAGDTSIVVGGSGAAPTIETGTLDVIAADHPPAASWSNNSFKITSLLNGSSAQDAAAFGQIPLADSTAANILPAGIQAAGANGKWADSGHVHQNNADLSLYLAPTGATGETFPRERGSSYSSALTSQQLYVTAIALPKGLAVNNITMLVGNTAAAATPTHGWYALLDSGRVVRAVTADQTTAWASTFSAVTLSVSASAYTTTYSGLYYIAIAITSGAAMPVFVEAGGSLGNAAGYAPILCGTIGSATQTTPPTTGTSMGAAAYVAGDRFYGYTS